MPKLIKNQKFEPPDNLQECVNVENGSGLVNCENDSQSRTNLESSN